MQKKQFEVRRDSREFYYKNRKKIEGFCVQTNDNDPEIISTFDTLDEAKALLSTLESSVVYYEGSPFNFYRVEQYYIEENEYDEDGEWVSGGDIWEWTPVTTPE